MKKIYYRLYKMPIKYVFLIAVVLSLAFGHACFPGIEKYATSKKLIDIMCSSAPSMVPKYDYSSAFFNSLFGFDFSDPVSILKSQIVMAMQVEEYKEEHAEPKITKKAKEDDNIEERTVSAPKVNSEDDVSIDNHTTYSFNKLELINEPLGFTIDKNQPSVLIVHSHTSESYTASEKYSYTESDPSRTENQSYNVVRVGNEVLKGLSDEGINAIHSTAVHDFPSYNGSYRNSLKTVESYLQKYPSIKVVIDIHRDAIENVDGKKVKFVTDIDGKKTAQVMIVTGTDQGGLEHPDWKENLKFALKLQRRMNVMYPGLTRYVDLRKERFNTHTTTGSVIIEVGTNGNTLEEAINAGYYVGKSLGNMLNFVAQ